MTTAGDRGIQDRGPGPYVGPRPFRSADSGRFFGRRAEARDVASLWMADRVTVLHGPGAVGKTSLLHAGVLPHLQRETGVDLLPVSGLGQSAARPLAAAPPFNGFSYALLSHWAQFEQPPALGTSISDFLLPRVPGAAGESAGAENAGAGPPSLLAAIDQFEVLFTEFPARSAERAEFIDELAAALRQVPSLKLLLVIGDDHLANLSACEQRLSQYPFSYVSLDALKPGAALDAVTGPLGGTGWSFADGVAQKLVDRLRTVTYTDLAGESATVVGERVEPLFLQIVCTELWSSLTGQSGVITADNLLALGDVDQALARYYDAAIGEVEQETSEPEARIREWIESVFITEHGTRGTAIRGLLTTAGMPNRVADALAQRHVLTAEHRARGTWYQLSQDRMISPVRAADRARLATLGRDIVRPVAAATPEALSAAAETALAEGNFPSARRFAEAAAAGYRDARQHPAAGLWAGPAGGRGPRRGRPRRGRGAPALRSVLVHHAGGQEPGGQDPVRGGRPAFPGR